MKNRPKILVVDDEERALGLVEAMLAPEGYEVVLAHSGEEGLEKARESSPDVILLDVMMPKKSGMMTYKALKRDPDLSSIPVIIITGIRKEVDFRSLFNRSSTGKIPPEGQSLPF